MAKNQLSKKEMRNPTKQSILIFFITILNRELWKNLLRGRIMFISRENKTVSLVSNWHNWPHWACFTFIKAGHSKLADSNNTEWEEMLKVWSNRRKMAGVDKTSPTRVKQKWESSKDFGFKEFGYLQHERLVFFHKSQWVGTGAWKTGPMGNHVPDRALIPGLLDFPLDLMWFGTELIFFLFVRETTHYMSPWLSMYIYFFLDSFVIVYHFTLFIFHSNEA